jgi:hypothetical protein
MAREASRTDDGLAIDDVAALEAWSRGGRPVLAIAVAADYPSATAIALVNLAETRRALVVN